MPDLPTITVSQEHFDRLVEVFPGATLAAKADAYKRWLINRLIERVQAVESQRITHEAQLAAAQAMEDLVASLPPKAEEPPLPVFTSPPATP
jgi:hypothetical protein